MYKNKEALKRYQKKYNKKYVADRQAVNRAWLLEIKAIQGCSTCLEKDPRCLDFHHIDPKQKSFTIGRRTSSSRAKLLTEINKCIVLCSNCHRKLTNPN